MNLLSIHSQLIASILFSIMYDDLHDLFDRTHIQLPILLALNLN